METIIEERKEKYVMCMLFKYTIIVQYSIYGMSSLLKVYRIRLDHENNMRTRSEKIIVD